MASVAEELEFIAVEAMQSTGRKLTFDGGAALLWV
jgi:hypothetical protein